MDQLAKSTTLVMHKMVLMQDWITTLEEANHILSKHQQEQKTHICQEESLTVQETEDILDEKKIDEQLNKKMHTITHQKRLTEQKKQQCGNCGKPRHNICMCQEDGEMSSRSDSD